MKKLIATLVLVCTMAAASANNKANTNAFVQPFDRSYAFDGNYMWFTDFDMENFTGRYWDVWTEINWLRNTFSGNQFSHEPVPGLDEFEFGRTINNQFFARIWSDLKRF